MLRAILAVILGYIVLAAFIFVTFSLTYFLLGPSFAFEPGTTDVTAGWMIVATVLNFVAAALGGWVAAKLARERSRGAVLALAILVVVLGVASAMMVMNAPAPVLPDRPLSTLEAATYAQQPAWYAFLLPAIGAAGVLLGGRWAQRAKGSAAEMAVS